MPVAQKLAFNFFFHIVNRRVHALGIIAGINAIAPWAQYTHFRKPDIGPVARSACVAPKLHLAPDDVQVGSDELFKRFQPFVKVTFNLRRKFVIRCLYANVHPVRSRKLALPTRYQRLVKNRPIQNTPRIFFFQNFRNF